MPYSLDTSYLVDAWKIWYPYEQFKQAWRLWASVARDGDLFVIDPVRSELQRHVKDMVEFFDAHVPHWTVSVSGDARLSAAMTSLEQALLQRGFKGQTVKRYMMTADPAIVLHAQLYGHAVVSIEESVPHTKKEPKLPDLCTERGIEHLTPDLFLARLGYSFEPVEPARQSG